VRYPLGCLVLSFLLAAPACAQGLSARSWEDCLNAPDRACLLEEALDLLNLQDKTDRRQTLVAAIAQTWAQAGAVEKAAQLAAQVPERLLARVAVLREIAAAEARASNHGLAEAAFDQALRLANGWKDPLQRAQALHSIAQAQAAAGMKAAADATFDQALQAAATVRTGRIAPLLEQFAMRQAEAGEIAKALQIARSIAGDPQTRVRTLLALADLQMRAGSAAEETFDEALAAERNARSSPTELPGLREIGIAVTASGSGSVRLLCDIAKAQARAGLTAKAEASFYEALRVAQSIKMAGPAAQGEAIADALATVADAQREAGLAASGHATLDRVAMVIGAITDDRNRAHSLARLAEVRTKAGDAVPGLFAVALAIARALPNDRPRARSLQWIAIAEADAGLRDEAARTFAEAARTARLQDEQMLSGNADARRRAYAEAILAGQGRWTLMLGGIADAQRRIELIKEAAATFEEALAATLSGDDQRNAAYLVSLIRLIVDNDGGKALVVVSPSLRTRLLEAAEAVTERVGRAEMMLAIARTMPN
jgi:hypothetical protein